MLVGIREYTELDVRRLEDAEHGELARFYTVQATAGHVVITDVADTRAAKGLNVDFIEVEVTEAPSRRTPSTFDAHVAPLLDRITRTDCGHGDDPRAWAQHPRYDAEQVDVAAEVGWQARSRVRTGEGAAQATVVIDGSMVSRRHTLLDPTSGFLPRAVTYLAASCATIDTLYISAVELDDNNRLVDLLGHEATLRASADEITCGTSGSSAQLTLEGLVVGGLAKEPTVIEDTHFGFTAVEDASYVALQPQELLRGSAPLQNLLQHLRLKTSSEKHQIVSVVVAHAPHLQLPNTTVQFVSFVVNELTRGMKSTRHCVCTAASLLESQSHTVPFSGTRLAFLLQPVLRGWQPGLWLACLSPVTPSKPQGRRETFKEAFCVVQTAAKVFSSRNGVTVQGAAFHCHAAKPWQQPQLLEAAGSSSRGASDSPPVPVRGTSRGAPRDRSGSGGSATPPSTARSLHLSTAWVATDGPQHRAASVETYQLVESSDADRGKASNGHDDGAMRTAEPVCGSPTTSRNILGATVCEAEKPEWPREASRASTASPSMLQETTRERFRERVTPAGRGSQTHRDLHLLPQAVDAYTSGSSGCERDDSHQAHRSTERSTSPWRYSDWRPRATSRSEEAGRPPQTWPARHGLEAVDPAAATTQMSTSAVSSRVSTPRYEPFRLAPRGGGNAVDVSVTTSATGSADQEMTPQPDRFPVRYPRDHQEKYREWDPRVLRSTPRSVVAEGGRGPAVESNSGLLVTPSNRRAAAKRVSAVAPTTAVRMTTTVTAVRPAKRRDGKRAIPTMRTTAAVGSGAPVKEAKNPKLSGTRGVTSSSPTGCHRAGPDPSGVSRSPVNSCEPGALVSVCTDCSSTRDHPYRCSARYEFETYKRVMESSLERLRRDIEFYVHQLDDARKQLRLGKQASARGARDLTAEVEALRQSLLLATKQRTILESELARQENDFRDRVATLEQVRQVQQDTITALRSDCDAAASHARELAEALRAVERERDALLARAEKNLGTDSPLQGHGGGKPHVTGDSSTHSGAQTIQEVQHRLATEERRSKELAEQVLYHQCELHEECQRSKVFRERLIEAEERLCAAEEERTRLRVRNERLEEDLRQRDADARLSEAQRSALEGDAYRAQVVAVQQVAEWEQRIEDLQRQLTREHAEREADRRQRDTQELELERLRRLREKDMSDMRAVEDRAVAAETELTRLHRSFEQRLAAAHHEQHESAGVRAPRAATGSNHPEAHHAGGVRQATASANGSGRRYPDAPRPGRRSTLQPNEVQDGSGNRSVREVLTAGADSFDHTPMAAHRIGASPRHTAREFFAGGDDSGGNGIDASEGDGGSFSSIPSRSRSGKRMMSPVPNDVDDTEAIRRFDRADGGDVAEGGHRGRNAMVAETGGYATRLGGVAVAESRVPSHHSRPTHHVERREPPHRAGVEVSGRVDAASASASSWRRHGSTPVSHSTRRGSTAASSHDTPLSLSRAPTVASQPLPSSQVPSMRLLIETGKSFEDFMREDPKYVIHRPAALQYHGA